VSLAAAQFGVVYKPRKSPVSIQVKPTFEEHFAKDTAASRLNTHDQQRLVCMFERQESSFYDFKASLCDMLVRLERSVSFLEDTLLEKLAPLKDVAKTMQTSTENLHRVTDCLREFLMIEDARTKPKEGLIDQRKSVKEAQTLVQECFSVAPNTV
jgi:hypothetical protein